MAFFRDKNSKGGKWDYERLMMVENQLKSRGIKDQKVLDAMGSIPRENFIPPQFRESAYKDGPVPIGEGQTISQPYMVAIMTECLKIGESDKILEIGTGSGYQMAVLLYLTPHVYSIERLSALAERARENLSTLGYKHLHIKVGDGSCGWPEMAPFNGIIVTSAAPEVPQALKDQLAEGGRLVIPVGTRYSQELYTIVKKADYFSEEVVTACVFVPLVGKYGWGDDY